MIGIHKKRAWLLSPIHFLLNFPQCTFGCSRQEHNSHVAIHLEKLRDLREKVPERINIHKKSYLLTHQPKGTHLPIHSHWHIQSYKVVLFRLSQVLSVGLFIFLLFWETALDRY